MYVIAGESNRVLHTTSLKRAKKRCQCWKPLASLVRIVLLCFFLSVKIFRPEYVYLTAVTLCRPQRFIFGAPQYLVAPCIAGSLRQPAIPWEGSLTCSNSTAAHVAWASPLARMRIWSRLLSNRCKERSRTFVRWASHFELLLAAQSANWLPSSSQAYSLERSDSESRWPIIDKLPSRSPFFRRNTT